MDPIAYTRPKTVERAVALVSADPSAAYIAGGTALLDVMKDYVERRGHLVDVNHLPGLKSVDFSLDGVRIGALVRNADLADHPEIGRRFPILPQALIYGALPQIRNMASVGGNLLQRTRCSYFRDPAFAACNKRAPGSGCAAIEGENRGHALLGVSAHCIASHPSDLAVAFAALEAVVHMVGPKGGRAIPIAALHREPGETPHVETVLDHGELITAVEVPQTAFAGRSMYFKIRDRQLYSTLSVAAALDIEDGAIRAARIALGGIATRPWRASEAERLLIGAPPSEKTFVRAAEAALADAVPHRDNAFKIPLAEQAIVHALTTLAAQDAQP